MKSKVEDVMKSFIGVGKKAYFYESVSYEEFKQKKEYNFEQYYHFKGLSF